MAAPLVALIAFAALALLFTAVWRWQLHSLNAGIIDPVWAASLGGVALLYAAAGTGDPLRRIVVGIGGACWGARLGIHLWQRNAGKPEDKRYLQLREAWGADAPRRMFGFFIAQAVASSILAIAFAVPAYTRGPPPIVCGVVAVAVWFVAAIGEALADRQLAAFTAQPTNRGRVCRAGLWRYSRHPNYFFECVHWLAYVPLAAGSAWIGLSVVPPLLMVWLLLKVSGIPILEAHLAESRPEYADYVRTTSALVPWPPRRTR
jgi:steroid 5-alpha reductase family enzyme